MRLWTRRLALALFALSGGAARADEPPKPPPASRPATPSPPVPAAKPAPKPGLPTAEALRKAQEFARSQEKWKVPYSWAAWVQWGLPS